MKEALLEISHIAAGQSQGIDSLNRFLTNLRPNTTIANQASPMLEAPCSSGILESAGFARTETPSGRISYAPSAANLAFIGRSWPWPARDTNTTELPDFSALVFGGSGISDILNRELLLAAKRISEDFASKVKELLSLEADWDGDGAEPVRVEALAKVVALLRLLKRTFVSFEAPFVAPTFDGAVLLDWASPRRTLEIQQEPGGWSIVGTSISRANQKEYYTAQSPIDASVAQYYEWVRGDLLIWPTG